MRRKISIRYAFLIVVFSTSLLSCSTEKYKKEIINTEVVGELIHRQYWDYNDAWDLKGLQLALHFDDGEIKYVDAVTKNASYIFEPSSPVGLSHDVTTIKLVGGTYKYNTNKVAPISGRVFESISIIDYPYQKPVYDTKMILETILLVLLLIFIVSFTTVIYLKKRKRSVSL